MTDTFFDLPNSPEEFSITLPPSNLRQIDFSGLDYTTARRAIIEYIRTYFPDNFNDFVASNGIMMIMEIIAAVTSKLSLRMDMLSNECFLPTARTEEAVINHLALINQKIKRQTPAVVDVEISISNPTFTEISIDAGLKFTIQNSPDDNPIVYEVYRAPGDWSNPIVIPAGKRGVIAWGVEGEFSSPVDVTSTGGPSQRVTIEESNILDSPLFVSVITGNYEEEWHVTSGAIEQYGPNDKVVEATLSQDSATFRFGDGTYGYIPPSGSTIRITFRKGGGIRGRIGIGQIDSTRLVTPAPPANAAVSVRFRNISPSSGGTDRETLAQAKRRAPRDFAVQRSIVTANDYAQSALSFSHPVYGAVSKAVATIKTSVNANLVEVYILADGPGNIPTTPNAGLKVGLGTYFDDLNVLTDHVDIKDGSIKPVDLTMDVIINKNSDASIVKENVESAISDFFDPVNWSMGQELYISKIIELVEGIDGVAYVNLHSPLNNILNTGQLASDDLDGVGINEIIIEGNRKTSYYYEKHGR